MSGLTWAGISDAAALDYPSQPMRWVVGYPASTAAPTSCASRRDGSCPKLDQQFIIENKPGAGNNIATEAVINARAANLSSFYIINPLIASMPRCIKLSFNFMRAIIAPVRRHHARSQCHGGQPQHSAAKTSPRNSSPTRANPNKVNLASTVRRQHIGPPLSN